MTILKHILLALIGLSSGFVIAGAVFAFIAIIGIVPRLAHKTRTTRYIRLYEEALILGGIFGASTNVIDYYIPIGKVAVVIFSLLVGVFYGCLAICLAEILDVIPILARRTKLKPGIVAFMLAIAFGKLFGSLAYLLVPGFYSF